MEPTPQTHSTIGNWILAGSTFLATFWAILVSGLKDWIKDKFWDKVFKSQVEREKQRPIKSPEFEAFKTTTASRLDELGRIVHAAACDMTDAAKEMRQNQNDNAREIRETLEVFKMAVDTSLGQVHDKANDANIKVAGFEGRLNALEKRAG